MPHWLIKTATHRAISWLPQRQFWNGLLQACFTKSTVLTTAHFEFKITECQRHLQAFLSLHPPVADFTVFELGTGWLPILPLGLYLCGAKEIWTADIDPLLRPRQIQQTLQYLTDYAERGALQKMLPEVRPERVEKLRSLLPDALSEAPVTLLARLNTHVLVIDAQKTPLPDRCVDFYVSNGVLEYIPRPVLQGILVEARRISAPGAVMSHRLNLIDQFAYFDRSITPFNFLQYTEKQWRWLNSPLIWQNRLRACDFRRLVAEAGFEVVRQENTSGSAEDLDKIKLAPEFRHYSREDLLVLHSYLTARLKS